MPKISVTLPGPQELPFISSLPRIIFLLCQFDLIVTNPPYFNKSLQPPDKVRHQVRHTASLSYEHLLSDCYAFVNIEGKV